MDNFQALRIIDANCNRAREALRIIEEYFRFIADSGHFSEQIKMLRHSLRHMLQKSNLNRFEMLAARDTAGDVGTAITTKGEKNRCNTQDILAANFARLEEGLRSIEEYAKLIDRKLSGNIKDLRYKVYDLEKESETMLFPVKAIAKARLNVLFTESMCRIPVEKAVEQAISGGADIIQLREKDMPDRQFLKLARKVKKVCDKSGTLLIINDRADIARLANASGVHLGQDDLPASEARKIIGPGKIIGISTSSKQEAEKALRDGADYIGVGPAFETETKKIKRVAGLEYVRYAKKNVKIPFFVIGSVNRDTINDVLKAGASRVAICSAVISSANIKDATRFFRQKLDKTGKSAK